jgi:hypothetical protein
MDTLRRGLVLGIAFGIAAATVEFWLGVLPVLERGFGPGAAFSVRMAPWIVGLGAVLGVATAPLSMLRGGRFLQLLALGGLWYAIERAVAIDSPLFAPMVIAVPVASAILVAIGFGLARFGPRVPWVVAAALFATGLFAPSTVLTLTRPAIETRSDLPPAPEGAPDVVLIVLDTVRAGSVSTYGYVRPTAPGLDALAAEGALFLDATSPSTWSLPSHASLFTGRYPSSHGAHAEHRYLDDRYPTLAQVLQGNGYDTFCITANAWISDGLGLTRGFAWQDESLRAQGGAGLAFSFIYRLLDRLGLQETDTGGAAVASRFEQWARACS